VKNTVCWCLTRRVTEEMTLGYACTVQLTLHFQIYSQACNNHDWRLTKAVRQMRQISGKNGKPYKFHSMSRPYSLMLAALYWQDLIYSSFIPSCRSLHSLSVSVLHVFYRRPSSSVPCLFQSLAGHRVQRSLPIFRTVIGKQRAIRRFFWLSWDQE
jgi:hypothetical protein